jgi:hypothetical protein
MNLSDIVGPFLILIHHRDIIHHSVTSGPALYPLAMRENHKIHEVSVIIFLCGEEL